MKISEVINKQIKGLWGTDFSDIKNGTPVIKTNNMTYEGVIDYSDICYRNIKKDTIGDNYLQKGDLLVEKSGGTKTHSVGYVNFFDGDNDTFVCNNFIIGLRPNNEIVDSKYLFYQLRYMYECGYFSDCYNKTTGIQNLKANQYLEKNIRVESKNRQKSIADELDGIVEAINLKRKEVSFLDELVKSRFIEMFGDPVENPKGWDKRPLSDECEIITGNTPSRKKPNYYGDFIEWIKSDNINTPNALLTPAAESLSEEGLKVGRSVEKDCILMTCIAGSIGCIGNVSVTDRKVAFNQQINAIIPNKNNVWFLYVLFDLSKSYIQSTVTMALKGILSKGQLSKIEFIFPPIELQNEFAEFVKLTDKSKFVCRFTPSIFYAIFLHSRHPP